MFSLDRVRRDEQSSFATHRRRYFKRSPRLLSKRFNELNQEDKDPVAQGANSELSSGSYYLTEIESGCCLSPMGEFSGFLGLSELIPYP